MSRIYQTKAGAYITLEWKAETPDEAMVHSNHDAFIVYLNEAAKLHDIKLPVLIQKQRRSAADPGYIIHCKIPVFLIPWRMSDVLNHTRIRLRNESRQSIDNRLAMMRRNRSRWFANRKKATGSGDK